MLHGRRGAAGQGRRRRRSCTREGDVVTTRDFVRRPRLPGPQVPGGEVELQPPPTVPRAVPGGLLQRLMPVVMVVAMLGMVALMVASGGMGNPMSLLFPIMKIGRAHV